MTRVALLISAATAAAAVVASAPAAAASRGCPSGALPLGKNAIAAAATAALRREPARADPQVVGAFIAARDPSARGRQVRAQCGGRAAARTVIVYVTRRALLPAQSASQGVYFVARFRTGYRVWLVAH